MRPFVIGLVVVVAGQLATAQTPAVRVPPDTNPVERMTPQVAPQLRPSLQGAPIIERRGPVEAGPVRVSRVVFTGNSALSDVMLAASIRDVTAEPVPRSRIEEARLAVLRAYRDAGYPFVTVAVGVTPLPDQSVVLTIAVTEGFVAEVRIEGDRDAIGPAGAQILGFLASVVGQRPASAAALERALLLSADVPGMRVAGTVRPLQTEPGALQLVVQVERRPVSGYFNVDNRGFEQVGPWQGLLVGGANSFTQFGERTELAVVGARSDSQRFAQISSEFFVGNSGLRLKGYVGAGRTRPLGDLRTIGYVGETQVAGFAVSYPVIRSRPLNFNMLASFDIFESEVLTSAGGSSTRASLDKVRTLRFGGDTQVLENSVVFFLPAATTTANARAHRGVDLFGATPTGSLSSGRSGADDFTFTKFTAELQRTQPIWSPGSGQMISVQGLAAGQWSRDVLPQSEKFFLGGSRLNRGFYSGQVTGDKAVSFAVELQYDIKFDTPLGLRFGGGTPAAQFYLFRDIGRSFENQDTDIDRRLSSFGIGARLTVNDSLQFDLEGVKRVTTRPDGAAADRLDDRVILSRAMVKF
jgi:hemolysin activation/secretion protein